jgi:hypothetical protein
MGVNIIVVTVEEMRRQAEINKQLKTVTEEEARRLDYSEHYHPDWDFIRAPADRDFANLAATLPQQNMIIDDETIFRPMDIPAWRLAIDTSNLPDKARFHHLLNIVEQDATQYILFSQ